MQAEIVRQLRTRRVCVDQRRTRLLNQIGQHTQLRRHLGKLDPRRQRHVGEIDILCKDAKGKYVVIEVKRWKDSDEVVGQILRYMGAIKEEKGSEPRGIIILNQEDKRLNYASSIVKSIETKYYKFNFAISDKPS